jgi:hypothetical protein
MAMDGSSSSKGRAVTTHQTVMAAPAVEDTRLVTSAACRPAGSPGGRSACQTRRRARTRWAFYPPACLGVLDRRPRGARGLATHGAHLASKRPAPRRALLGGGLGHALLPAVTRGRAGGGSCSGRARRTP